MEPGTPQPQGQHKPEIQPPDRTRLGERSTALSNGFQCVSVPTLQEESAWTRRTISERVPKWLDHLGIHSEPVCIRWG